MYIIGLILVAIGYAIFRLAGKGMIKLYPIDFFSALFFAIGVLLILIRFAVNLGH